MNGWPSLLADAEMFKIILVVVAGLIALVKHFVDANGKAQARRPVAKPEVRPRVKPPPAAARPAMPGDVNEFLRRAAEKRAAAQRAPASESAAAPRRLVTSPLDASDEVVHAQAVDEVHSANRVGAHVQQHLEIGRAHV